MKRNRERNICSRENCEYCGEVIICIFLVLIMVQLSFKEKWILFTDLLTIIIVNLFIFYIFPNDSFLIYTFIVSVVYIIFNSLFSLRVTRNIELK